MRRRVWASLAAAVLIAGAVLGGSGASAAGRPRSRPVSLPERSGPAIETAPAPRAHERLPAMVPLQRDALTRALESGHMNEAEYALQRALSLFDLDGVRTRFGDVARPPARAATMLLRDLVVRLGGLSHKQMQRARRVLARPDDNSTEPEPDFPKYSVPSSAECTTSFCIHWVDTSGDAPDPTDTNGNSIPDYVETVAAVMEDVRAHEIQTLGYKAPKPDTTSTNNGGDDRFDVYLANIDDDRLYGYCTTDDPNAQPRNGYQYWDFSAYCVLDNDYAAFPAPPTASLQVTAAHEYFHAVQFAYDAAEDLWFMEGTAAWMEDEVYDEINDNYQYLFASALIHPEIPVDYGDEGFEYGAWLFWRFLSEALPQYLDANAQEDPSIITQIWEQADGSPTGPDRYSLAAAANVLQARGLRFRFAFADFAAANYVADAFYDEGREYIQVAGYPPEFRARITRTRPRRSRSITLDHLTSAYAAYRPGKGVRKRARLKVSIDAPSYRSGPEATVVVIKKSGAIRIFAIRLDRRGNGSKKVPFFKRKGPKGVFSATVVVSNASTRFKDCYLAGTDYSCMGTPRDEDLRFKWTATLS